MKALIIILSMMAFVTVSQAQQWVYDTSAPYINQPISDPDEDPIEGKTPLGKKEIPSEVIQAFRMSPFQHMTITQVFRLQDQALSDVVLNEEAEAPLLLYEFRLVYDGKQACLYFTPDGELYEPVQSV